MWLWKCLLTYACCGSGVINFRCIFWSSYKSLRTSLVFNVPSNTLGQLRTSLQKAWSQMIYPAWMCFTPQMPVRPQTLMMGGNHNSWEERGWRRDFIYSFYTFFLFLFFSHLFSVVSILKGHGQFSAFNSINSVTRLVLKCTLCCLGFNTGYD